MERVFRGRLRAFSPEELQRLRRLTRERLESAIVVWEKATDDDRGEALAELFALAEALEGTGT